MRPSAVGSLREHQPLFVLRQHGCALLSSSFYPSPDATERQEAQRNGSGHFDHLFLSGDVDGNVILWDLDVRCPLLTFNAIQSATEEERRSEEADEEREAARHAAHGGVREAEDERARLRALRDAIREAGTAGDGPIGVLAVGFLRVGKAPAVPRAQREHRRGETETRSEGELVSAALSKDTQGEQMLPGGMVALNNSSSSSPSGRRRFRHTRRPAASDSAAHPAGAVVSSEESCSTDNVVFFFTHCRNQRLYVWSFGLDTCLRVASLVSTGCPSPSPDHENESRGGLRLLFTLHVPHHGFCPVASTTVTTWETEEQPRTLPGNGEAGDGSTLPTHPQTSRELSALLAIPGEGAGPDGGGVVTTWRLSLAAPHVTADDREKREEGQGPCGQPDGEGDDGGDDEGDVDISGMDPMDALIARSVAKEQAREARRREAPTQTGQGRSGPQPLFAARSRGQPARDGAGAQWGNPLRATFAGAVSVLPGEFSVKSGVVMRLDMQAAAPQTGPGSSVVLSTSFESGHVTLTRLSVPPLLGSGKDGRTVVVSHVLAAVRAFPESAMTCTWRPQSLTKAAEKNLSGLVVATSAEGQVQCFRAVWGSAAGRSHFKTADPHADDESCPSQLALVPCWSTSLPKGIGSACVVGRLLILGCWDGSLRLYDVNGQRPQQAARSPAEVAVADGDDREHAAENGSLSTERAPALVSILPFHVPSAVNEVAAVSSVSLGALAAFAFDPRAPRLDAVGQPAPHVPRIAEAAVTTAASAGVTEASQVTVRQGCGVHVFASASKDGRVSIWRVDFTALAETGRLLSRPAVPLLPSLPA